MDKNMMLERIKQYQRDFCNWYREETERDENFLIDVNTIFLVVDRIVAWYHEFTFQEYLFRKDNIDFSTYFRKKLQDARLVMFGSNIFECYYCSSNFLVKENRGCYQDSDILYAISLPCKDKEKNKERSIVYMDKFGMVSRDNIQGLGEEISSFDETVSLHYLLHELKKNNEFDVSELEKCISSHDRAVLLREKILLLAVCSIISSFDSVEDGLFMGKRFLGDFNYCYGLNLKLDFLLCDEFYENTKRLTDKKRIRRLREK